MENCVFCKGGPSASITNIREYYLQHGLTTKSDRSLVCERCKIHVLAYIKYRQLHPVVKYILWRVGELINVWR